MKICILGNSHVGGIKRGWDSISHEYSDYSLTFFASTGDSLRKLRLAQGKLIPRSERLARHLSLTSGGLDSITLSEYDAFLIYGLGLYIPILDTRLSASVIDQVFIDVWFSSLTFKLIKLIRSASFAPIYVGHTPLPSGEPGVFISNNTMTYPKAFSLTADSVGVVDCFLVEQPAISFADPWVTKTEFSMGSMRLLNEELHLDKDTKHMNQEFGKIWLLNYFEKITKNFQYD